MGEWWRVGVPRVASVVLLVEVIAPERAQGLGGRVILPREKSLWDSACEIVDRLLEHRGALPNGTGISRLHSDVRELDEVRHCGGEGKTWIRLGEVIRDRELDQVALDRDQPGGQLGVEL